MVVTDLLFNVLIDWLEPVSYDGRAHIKLPETDPRLRLHALLAWEAKNAVQALDLLMDGVVAPLAALLAKADARDKAARLVQYALRLIVGILARRGAAHGKLRATLAKLMTTLSDARRTHRWLKLAPLLALRPGAPLWSEPRWPRLLAVANRVTLLTFLCTDHTRWLQQHGLVRGKPATTSMYAMRLLASAHGVQAIYLLHRAWSRARECRRLRSSDRDLRTLDAEQGAADAEAEAVAAARGAAKQAMCLLQAGHLGKVRSLETNDAFVGMLGVLTSASDLRGMWPKAAPKQGKVKFA